jgi:hypothetical protein
LHYVRAINVAATKLTSRHLCVATLPFPLTGFQFTTTESHFYIL